MKILLYLSILLLVGFTKTYSQDEFHIDLNYRYIITQDDDGILSLKSEETYSEKHLEDSNKSFYYVSDPFYSEVEEIQAYYGDKKLKGKYISHHSVNAEDVFLSDNKFYEVYFPKPIGPGQVIKYKVQRKYDELFYMPLIQIPNKTSYRPIRATFIHPENLTVDFEVLFSRDSIPYKIIRNGGNTTSIIFNKTAQQKHLNNFPFNDFQASILATFKSQDKVVNGTTEKSFTSWYQDKVDLSPTDFAPDDYSFLFTDTVQYLEPIEVFHNYIRSNVKYIADISDGHSFIPHNPRHTINNLYGDCKDRAYLLSSLAHSFGNKAMMALVSTTPIPQFKGVHFSLYDHVICYGIVANKNVFFDPTCKDCPIGYLPEREVDKYALILDTKNPRKEKVFSNNTETGTSLRIKAEINELNNAEAKIIMRGSDFLSFISILNNSSKENLRAKASLFLNQLFSKLGFTFLAVIKQDDYSVEIKSLVDLSKAIIKGGSDKIYVSPSIFNIYPGSIKDRLSDDYQIYFDTRLKLNCNIELNAPEYTSEPRNLEIGSNDLFSYRASISDNQNSIIIDYKFNQPIKVINKSLKPIYSSFLDDLKSLNNSSFILKSK